MEEEGALGIQNWAKFYQSPPLKRNLGLQLMSNVAIADTFPPKRCFFPAKGANELSSMPIEHARDYLYHTNDKNGIFTYMSFGAILSEATAASAATNAAQALPIQEKEAIFEDSKQKTTKKAKKAGKSAGRRRSAAKNLDMVINGIGLDLSGIPAPRCTCTGRPQQCYRWGAGGWQSACCTTSISVYPLPMSAKRRGARIAGRKMSQGAFKKVLEKLAGEGEDFSNPIDLKPFWAKHGTNKFVTIR